jgi:uncharacterized protein involved in tellurium resistance
MLNLMNPLNSLYLLDQDMEYLYHQYDEGQARLKSLLNRIGDNIQLYYLFFKCDTRTGDKTQAPVKWFEQTIRNIEVVEF